MVKGETLREGSKAVKPRRPTLTSKVVRGLDWIINNVEAGADARTEHDKTFDKDSEAGMDYIRKLIAWHDVRQK